MQNSNNGENTETELSESLLQVVALSLTQETSLLSEKLAPISAVGNNDCEVEGEKNVIQISSDRQIEQFISQILKYGVLLASSIVLVGGVLYLMRHGTEPADYQFFHEETAFRSPLGALQAILSNDPRGVIQLGIFVLIVTPIARVAFSLFFFLRQQDLIYVFVTSFVLAGLIYSLIGAYF
jgi:uncharacterized membrane protein